MPIVPGYISAYQTQPGTDSKPFVRLFYNKSDVLVSVDLIIGKDEWVWNADGSLHHASLEG